MVLRREYYEGVEQWNRADDRGIQFHLPALKPTNPHA
jgi:hypothetical protein